MHDRSAGRAVTQSPTSALLCRYSIRLVVSICTESCEFLNDGKSAVETATRSDFGTRSNQTTRLFSVDYASTEPPGYPIPARHRKLLNGKPLRIRMVFITMRNDTDRLIFREGLMPEMDLLRSSFPRSPNYFEASAGDKGSRDEAFIWTLQASCCKHAAKNGYDLDQLAFHTWMLGRPYKVNARGPPDDEDAKLAGWFVGKPPHYRVLIHHQAHGDPSTHFYSPTPMYTRLRVRHHTGTFKTQKRQTERFLIELLRGYNQGIQAVERIVRNAGHPYWFSDAMVKP